VRGAASLAVPLLCFALAPAAPAAPAFEPKISVYVDRSGDAVAVDIRALVPVLPRIVWDVLTDYNRIATFVPGLKVSRLLSGAGEPLLLEQKGGVSVAVFSFDIDVVARVEELPFNTIRFEAVRGNMREMRGEWNVEDLGEGSRLRYRVHVVPSFWVPPVIGPALIRRNFLEQFDALTREMMRRAAAPVGGGGIPAQ